MPRDPAQGFQDFLNFLGNLAGPSLLIVTGPCSKRPSLSAFKKEACKPICLPSFWFDPVLPPRM